MLVRFIELAPAGVVDTADSIGWTPLFWACNNGHGGQLCAVRCSAVVLCYVLCSTVRRAGC